MGLVRCRCNSVGKFGLRSEGMILVIFLAWFVSCFRRSYGSRFLVINKQNERSSIGESGSEVY